MKQKKSMSNYERTKVVARRAQEGATHPLQIWMHPLGIFKISRTNMMISPLKKKKNVLHPTASTCYLCWTAAVGKTHFQKCTYKQDIMRNVIRRITHLTVFILWSSQRDFLSLCVHKTYVQYMYKRVLYTYINVCTYMHPLCSSSGCGPGKNASDTQLLRKGKKKFILTCEVICTKEEVEHWPIP